MVLLRIVALLARVGVPAAGRHHLAPARQHGIIKIAGYIRGFRVLVILGFRFSTVTLIDPWILD